MAVPRFIAASTGATDAGGAWTATGSAPGAAGRLIILQVLQDGATSGAVAVTGSTNINDLAGSAGWTSIGTFAVGSPTAAYQHLRIGRSTSTSAPTASGTNSTSEDLYWRFYEFADVNTGTTLASVIENGTAGSTANEVGTSATASFPTVTTLGLDRLALAFLAVNDDNVVTGIGGTTTGASWGGVTAYAESSGTDGLVYLAQARPWSLGFDAVGLTGSIYGGTGIAEQQAQSFTTSDALAVSRVDLYLTKNNSPSDSLTVEFQSDSSGLPSGTVVGTAATIAAADVVTSTYHSLAASASLAASTKYWLVARRTGSRDTTNYLTWAHGLTTDGYSGGEQATRDSGTWTTGSGDRQFGLQVSTGATISGGTIGITDSDAWGVVGFALIGTTVVATATSLPPIRPYPYHLITR